MGRRSRAHQTGELPDFGRGGDPVAAPTDERAGFALAIAALSTTAALALFFTATVPAMQEDHFLRDVEAEREEQRKTLWGDLDAETSSEAALEVDIQSLLVELDRRGVFPAESVTPAPKQPGSSPSGQVHTQTPRPRGDGQTP